MHLKYAILIILNLAINLLIYTIIQCQTSKNPLQVKLHGLKQQDFHLPDRWTT